MRRVTFIEERDSLTDEACGPGRIGRLPKEWFESCDTDRWASYLDPASALVVALAQAGVGQNASGTPLGIKGPSVHARRSKAWMRMEILARIGDPPGMTEFLADYPNSQTLTLLWESPSPTAIAAFLGMNQSTIRDRADVGDRLLGASDSPHAQAWVEAWRLRRWLAWTRPRGGGLYDSGTCRPGTLRDWFLSSATKRLTLTG